MNSEVGSHYVLRDSLKLKCLRPDSSQMHQRLHQIWGCTELEHTSTLILQDFSSPQKGSSVNSLNLTWLFFRGESENVARHFWLWTGLCLLLLLGVKFSVNKPGVGHSPVGFYQLEGPLSPGVSAVASTEVANSDKCQPVSGSWSKGVWGRRATAVAGL